MSAGGEKWGEGYITEVEYVSGCFREFNPSCLNFALLQKRIRPRPIGRGFDYMELGCGHGLTLNVTASLYPEGRFFGLDYNPAHILNAREFADAAGLTNVSLFDKSFAEMGALDLPDFDFIVMHGIYSWVSEVNREEIRKFILRKLKPGGVVYVSYNAMPGKNAAGPFQFLMKRFADTRKGSPQERVRHALAFLDRLKGSEAAHFLANPGIGNILDNHRNLDPVYLAHEYLNDNWKCFHHFDIASEMSAIKLSYAASTTLVNNLGHLLIDPAMQGIVNEFEDPALRETILDYLLNTTFRTDIFVRGVMRLTDEELIREYRNWRFALIVRKDEIKTDYTVPRGEVHLSSGHLHSFIDALEGGPRTIGELEPLMCSQGLDVNRIIDGLNVLCALNIVVPVLPGERESVVRSCEGMNRAIVAYNDPGMEFRVLASPLARSPIYLDTIDSLFIKGIRNNEPNLNDFVIKCVHAAGKAVLKDGKPISTAAEVVAEMDRRFYIFRTELIPFYRMHGIEFF